MILQIRDMKAGYLMVGDIIYDITDNTQAKVLDTYLDINIIGVVLSSQEVIEYNIDEYMRNVIILREIEVEF